MITLWLYKKSVGRSFLGSRQAHLLWETNKTLICLLSSDAQSWPWAQNLNASEHLNELHIMNSLDASTPT